MGGATDYLLVNEEKLYKIELNLILVQIFSISTIDFCVFSGVNSDLAFLQRKEDFNQCILYNNRAWDLPDNCFTYLSLYEN